MALREGEVTTYGDVAEVAGHPRQARLVGRILATTDADVPWWRVVNAAGRLVAGDPALQSQLLRDEEVVIDGRTCRRRPDRAVQPVASIWPLIWTNAKRMLASASCMVGASSPSRAPRPSTRQATASMASAD